MYVCQSQNVTSLEGEEKDRTEKEGITPVNDKIAQFILSSFGL